MLLALSVNPAFLPAALSADAIAASITQPETAGPILLLSFPQDFTFDPTKAYTFTITAQSNLSKQKTMGSYKISYKDGVSADTDQVPVPAFSTPDQITGLAPIATDDSIVDVLMGIGAHITFQNYPDYTVATNSVLVSTRIGQAVPSVLIGAGFTTGAYKIHPSIGKYSATKFGKEISPDSIFVNAQVPVGSSISSDGSINGFTFGVGYKVQKFLEILVGFSFAQYNDPSVGFRNAAAAVVTANAQLPSGQQVPLYSLYNADDIRKDKPDALDGFPLLQQVKGGTPGGQIYAGSALLNHYRGGLFLGLAYPLSISKIFQSKQ